MKRSLLAFGLAFTLLACSTACERRGATTTGDGTGVIKVGVYMDLSGQTASFGQSSVNGIRMATDEINNAGGINGRKLELVIEDDQGRPEQAATVVTKLINQDKVHVVVGEVASSNSLAAAPIAQNARVPMITPSSTNPKVTQVGDYIFRVCFIDPFQGEALAKFATNTLNAKRVAILSDVNSDYSRGLAQFFKETFTKSGGQIVQEQSYTQNDRDFSSQLTTIRAANPDVVLIPGYYGQVGVIARQARQQGMNMPLLGGDGWDAPQLLELGGEALRNTFFSNHYSVDDPNPRIQKFVNDYRARFNITPDAIAACGYDAMLVLADALRRAGTTDGAKLRDAIAATQSVAGVTGTISINAERNAVKPLTILEVKDGKFAFKELVQPGGAPAASTTASPAATTTTASPATTNTSPAATPAGNTVAPAATP